MKAPFIKWAAAALVLTLAGGTLERAQAERVRYHFAPADLCGNTVQIPAGKHFAIGERVSYLGLGNTPYNCPKRPTHVVAFCHPFTGRTVNVPLALPPDTPRIAHGTNRITFDYGGYTVTTVFLPDGSVDTIYDSGLFRPLQ